MSIFKKLITAVRGGVTEVGEAIVDTQAFRILEQEIRDAKLALEQSKVSLTNIVAQKIAIERTLKTATDSITEHESYVIKALDKDDETLALEVSEKIANLEQQRDANQAVLNSFESQVITLKKAISQADSNIQSCERELRLVETTDKVQKANDLANKNANGSNSSLSSATDSLARIRERQQRKEDQAAANIELAESSKDESLQTRLEEAGIIKDKNSAHSVLDRLKKSSKTKQS
ncbi:MAG: PspA/IM30 family protein [Saccharospirillaceae bacterium]|nr:PspA/IM30 family protein [Pseudomonadales bacterium]NRB79784.1 PspA/IM30 family protein [Saccharospirillaceae bacterium]